jgi:hypothetical protein
MLIQIVREDSGEIKASVAPVKFHLHKILDTTHLHKILDTTKSAEEFLFRLSSGH